MKRQTKIGFSIIVGVLSLLVGVFNLLRSSTPDILLLCVAVGTVVLILIELYRILD
jgi:hypothetical protein